MQRCETKQMLLIRNPAAGKKQIARKAARRLSQVVAQLEQNGYHVDVQVTQKAGDAQVIAEKLAGQYDVVTCYGGDGTLHEVVNGLMHTSTQIPVGYLPAGTTNDMARGLHLPVGLRKTAQVLLNGRTAAQDIGCFNDSVFFSYVASFGALTSIAYTTPQWIKNRLGYLAYLLQVLRCLAELRPYALEMKIDGKECKKGRYLFGSISNTYSISGIFRFKPEDVCLNDGQFELMLIRYPENILEFFQIAANLIRRTTDGHFVIFRHVHTVEFRFDEATSWTVDGEDGGASRAVRIRNLPRALTFIHDRPEAG